MSRDSDKSVPKLFLVPLGEFRYSLPLSSDVKIYYNFSRFDCSIGGLIPLFSSPRTPHRGNNDDNQGCRNLEIRADGLEKRDKQLFWSLPLR